MAMSIDPKQILIETLQIVLNLRSRFVKALLIPFALYVVIDLAQLLLSSIWFFPFLFLLGVLVETLFAITTHRLVLLGSGSVPAWGLNRITKREAMFLFYYFVFSLILLIPSFVSPLLYYLGLNSLAMSLFLVLMIVVVVIRLSLVFPAIAIDQGVTFGLSFQLTQKHQLPLLVTLLAFPLILLLPIWAFADSREPAVVAIVSLLYTLLYVFDITALSLSYREISKIEYAA